MAETVLRQAIRHLLVGLHKAEGGDDAALLARFAAWRDEAAFELIVFRHGPMVRGVCRRLLRHEQDAEDAFQATFLALARKAGSVRGAVGGWLYRVACHAALKARARAAKRRVGALRDVVAAIEEPAELRELRGILDEEVLRLPERFRLPVVLCYLQGKSNTEAAAELGCPRGTVDSRLSEARRRLRGRLVRRGLAPAVGVALEQLLVPSAELSAAAVRPVVAAALAFVSHHPVAATAVPAAAATLAQGVLQVMYLQQLKWAACLALVLVTLGTGGLATFRAAADDPPAKDAKAPAKAAAPAVVAGKLHVNADAIAAAGPADARAIRKLFQSPLGVDKWIANLPLRDALDYFGDKFNVPIRIDPEPFLRYKPDSEPLKLYELPVTLRGMKGLSFGDALRDLLAPLKVEGGGDMRLTFLARGRQIVIVPAYMTPYGRTPDSAPFLMPEMIEEQALGEWVTVDLDNVSVSKALRDLADQTGANIVLDPRYGEMAKTPVTLTLQQVRLYKALQVLADLADLKPVVLHNVYYVTDAKNADKLEKAERPTTEPPPSIVPGGKPVPPKP